MNFTRRPDESQEVHAYRVVQQVREHINAPADIRATRDWTSELATLRMRAILGQQLTDKQHARAHELQAILGHDTR